MDTFRAEESQLVTMKGSIVLVLLPLVNGLAQCGDSSATVRGRCYEEEVLLDNLYRARNLVVDFHTNVLYFSNNTAFRIGSSSCYLNLNTKQLGVISQIPSGRAHAVDQVRHEVYIAGRDGIYKFYYNNKTVERVANIDGPNIWSMYYRDELYYTRFSRRVFSLKDGESTEVDDLKGKNAELFVIDKDGDRFFGNFSGLFGGRKGSGDVHLYEKGMYLIAMTTDLTGMPYLCQLSSVYSVNKDKKAIQEIGRLGNGCDGLAFDKDNNIIYSTFEKIVKLKLKLL